jgi:hypothetical protein
MRTNKAGVGWNAYSGKAKELLDREAKGDKRGCGPDPR